MLWKMLWEIKRFINSTKEKNNFIQLLIHDERCRRKLFQSKRSQSRFHFRARETARESETDSTFSRKRESDGSRRN